MASRRASASTASIAASRAVESQLERYRGMRDFHLTREPRGGTRTQLAAGKGLPFVVQKHAATRLHYDFRLGWQGVLKSWAVTKGPSLYPGDKRLAVQVEDHPIEYGGFEGTIPKGQYGGGAVMVWDFGEWVPEGDAEQGLAEGHIKFELKGKKLKGRWALVRMHGKAEREDKPNWLLIKEKDQFAQPADGEPITESESESAVTGRSLEEIAASEDHVWNSAKSAQNGKAPGEASAVTAKAAATGSERKTQASRSVEKLLQSAPREKLPAFIAPQLAQSSLKAPQGRDWIHELKLDGYRVQMNVRRPAGKRAINEVRLLTRSGLDWTKRMPDIAHSAAELDVEAAIIDGELVALDEKGVSSFANLQAAFQDGHGARHGAGQQTELTYFAFDVLHCNGHNVRGLSLLERKQILEAIFSGLGKDSALRLSEHLEAQGETVFRHACALGAEGIVSKLGSSAYHSGRSSAWLKVKCIQEQEFVIGGFTPPSKGGHGVGALLLGYYAGSKLRYAGRSGTGFTQATQRLLRTRLDGLRQEEMSFSELPQGAGRDALWVKPALVAQISFATWTADNLLRQAAFKGLREDKPAREVVREVAMGQAKLEDAGTGKASGAASKTPKGSGPTVALALKKLTHPGKILDAQSGMTKQSLADYYVAVAERMLPHIADRPLSVVRCPEGSGKPCFYQKHVGRGLPEGVGSISIPNRKSGAKEEFLTVDTAEGLVSMAQMGVLEIHPWGSRKQSLDKPDRIIIDLDPDVTVEWKMLAACAGELRERLKQLGLVSFLKSTGGKGLHVVAPIEPEQDWPTVKQFTHHLVLEMEAAHPDLYLTKMTKAARKGRIYLDYLRNDWESTAVAPWSPRARVGAPVAVPLAWSELDADALPTFHVMDMEEWKGRLRKDVWKAMTTTRQKLPS